MFKKTTTSLPNLITHKNATVIRDYTQSNLEFNLCDAEMVLSENLFTQMQIPNSRPRNFFLHLTHSVHLRLSSSAMDWSNKNAFAIIPEYENSANVLHHFCHD